MMTAIETVDNLVLSIASFQNCSYVNMTLRIESTERRKINMQVKVYVLLHKYGQLTMGKLKELKEKNLISCNESVRVYYNFPQSNSYKVWTICCL